MAPPKYPTVKTSQLAKQIPDSTPERCLCVVCGRNLCFRRDIIVRHYERFHTEGINILANGEKSIFLRSRITTKEQYIAILMRIISAGQLSFSFFDDVDVRELLSIYGDHFGVTCSAWAIRRKLIKHSRKMQKAIKKELQNRIISIKFDIASRKGRRILGITAQFIKDWKLQIRYLAMAEIKGPANADNLQRMINECLADYGLIVLFVYSSTTDCGGNVLNASALVLGESEKNDVPTSISDEKENGNNRDQREQRSTSQDDILDSNTQLVCSPISLTEDSEAFSVTENDSQTDDDADDSDEDYDQDPDYIPEYEEGADTDSNADEEVEEALETASDAAICTVLGTKCAAHVCQLAVKDWMKEDGRKEFVEEMKKTAKEVCLYMDQLPPTTIKPAQPHPANDTRWGSAYEMVRILSHLIVTI